MSVKEMVVGNMNIVFIGSEGKFDMLDYWNEIVSSVFIDDVSYGRTPKYLLKDIKIKKIGKGKEPIIIGRYVKSTVLSIKQVLENNELIPKDEKHDSAPSAVFVYLLKNHILLYWGEHPGYPSVKSFKTFLSKCINRNRKKYIKLLSKGKKVEEKLKIVAKIPEAYVSYIPLPLTKSIDAQFNDLVKISKLSVRQFYQNANLDYRSVMGSNQSLMAKVKSQRLDYSLAGIEDINGTKELVKEIADAGDSLFRVDGSTEEGKKQITNEGIQYSQYFNKVSENAEVEIAAEGLYDAYIIDVKKGNIPLIPPKNSDDKLARVNPNDRT